MPNARYSRPESMTANGQPMINMSTVKPASHRRAPQYTLHVNRQHGGEADQDHAGEQGRRIAGRDQPAPPQLDGDNRLRRAPLMREKSHAGRDEQRAEKTSSHDCCAGFGQQTNSEPSRC